MILRGLTVWGLNDVLAHLSASFSSESIFFSGRGVTNDNQSCMRKSLQEAIDARCANGEFVVFLLSDYGRILRYSEADKFHSMLYGRLIDGINATDIGAIIAASPGDRITRKFRGSPILGRLSPVGLPELDERDAVRIGSPLISLKERFGDSTWLARRSLTSGEDGAHNEGIAQLSNCVPQLQDELPDDVRRYLAGESRLSDVGIIHRPVLSCFGTFESSGDFKPSQVVSDSGILNRLTSRAPGWPRHRSDSVTKFVRMLEGADSAIWVDRYMYSCLGRVAEFIAEVRKRTSCRIRILTSSVDRDECDPDEWSRFCNLKNIAISEMNQSDYSLLHDRQLILPILEKGYNLPTVRVLVGMDNPGSAVSSEFDGIPLDYAECWSRADLVWTSDL